MKNRVTDQRLVDMGRKALAQEICHRSGGIYDLEVLMSMSFDELKVLSGGLPEENIPWDFGEIKEEKDASFTNSRISLRQER